MSKQYCHSSEAKCSIFDQMKQQSSAAVKETHLGVELNMSSRRYPIRQTEERCVLLIRVLVTRQHA